MLKTDAELVRVTLSQLQATRELSAETFLFAGQAWRVAPSDVSKIQLKISALATLHADTEKASADTASGRPERRIVRRTRT